jgi:hypothetical protein
MAFEILGTIAAGFVKDLIAKRKDSKDPEVPQLRPMDTQVRGTTTGVPNLRAGPAAGDAGDVVPPFGIAGRLERRYREYMYAMNVDEGAVKGATSRTRIA